MSTETSSTKTTRTRVFQHPQARIKPLDADTLHEARTCLVYENGEAVAQLKRCGQRCWVRLPDRHDDPCHVRGLRPGGRDGVEAVTAWMSARSGEAS